MVLLLNQLCPDSEVVKQIFWGFLYEKILGRLVAYRNTIILIGKLNVWLIYLEIFHKSIKFDITKFDLIS